MPEYDVIGNLKNAIDQTKTAIVEKFNIVISKQLPDNHQVQVSNQLSQPIEDGGTVVSNKGTGWVDGITDAELRAADVPVTLGDEQVEVTQGTSPWVVSGSLTPSGIQQVNITESVEVEVTLNGESVALDANTLSALSPQTDALTDTELRASAVKVDDDETQAKLDTIAANQLPDNHNVTVSNFTVQLDGLTDSELRAAPVVVDTQLTQPTTPADTQPVSGTVSVDNFPANQTDALTDAQLRATAVKVDDDETQAALATIAGNQLPDNHQVAVSNQIAQPVQDGGTVNVGNFPANQTDALTNSQLRASAVAVDTGLEQPTTPSDTQPISGTVTVANPTANPETGLAKELTLQSIQAELATQQKDALTETQLRGVVPDQAGAWGYGAGASGNYQVPANKRVLQISATAGVLAASFTIDGGAVITIPSGRSLTVEPKGNLSAPNIAFTNTTAYFVEWVE